MRSLSVILFLLLSQTIFAQTSEVPKAAVCVVCAILHGESEPEKVKARSEHEGAHYFFCSDNCKKEFDADPAAFLPPVLPRPAPEFAVTSLTGDTLTLDRLKGKWALLDFWATWCKPCETMMPHLQKLHEEFSARNFAVIGVAIDEGKDAAQKVTKFIEKRKLTYPIYLDSKNDPAWAAFRVKAIPAMFLLNPAGQIVQEWRGEIKPLTIRSEVSSRLQ